MYTLYKLINIHTLEIHDYHTHFDHSLVKYTRMVYGMPSLPLVGEVVVGTSQRILRKG